MTTPARETINLAEIEQRANQCVRMHMGLLLDPDVALRMIGIIRDLRYIGSGRPYSAEVVARYQREWLASHDIIDEPTP